MTTYGIMRRSSFFALLPLLLAALVLGVDGMKVLPGFTAPGTVSKCVRTAVASYKDPVRLSAVLGRFPPRENLGQACPLPPFISYSPHLDGFLPY